ncbi:MAG: nucleotide exchange factor GrpE [Firmicutes bacterium]|nr:nucleotide exchange factor GrpE [Bacillota bacterium]MCL1954091.1 nucleotide exchange factor GrpE [Bacillota bacterium]
MEQNNDKQNSSKNKDGKMNINPDSIDATNELAQLKDLRQREIEEAKSIFEAMQIANQKDRTRIEELNKAYERLQDDFKQYQKRTEEKSINMVSQGKSEAAVAMIPVLDIVYNAIDMIKDKASRDGVVMISKKMETVLSNLGVEELKSEGNKFDPELHNALMRVEVQDPDMDGKVVEVMQRGYSMGGKVIRHAQVKVGYKA